MPLDFNGLQRLLTSVELAYELAHAANETEDNADQRMRHAARCAITNERIEPALYGYAEAFMDSRNPKALLDQLRNLFRRWL
jgi:hypothetical protein